MKYIKLTSIIFLSAIAATTSALPVPPFSENAELISATIAIALYLGLLLLPIFKHLRMSLVIFVFSAVPIRIISEALWDFWPAIIPDQFFVLSNVIGTDGEGVYNSDTYQIFLLGMLISLFIVLIVQSNKKLNMDSGADAPPPIN